MIDKLGSSHLNNRKKNNDKEPVIGADTLSETLESGVHPLSRRMYVCMYVQFSSEAQVVKGYVDRLERRASKKYVINVWINVATMAMATWVCRI